MAASNSRVARLLRDALAEPPASPTWGDAAGRGGRRSPATRLLRRLAAAAVVLMLLFLALLVAVVILVIVNANALVDWLAQLLPLIKQIPGVGTGAG